MEELFQNDLLKDEKIFWTGQPEPSILFTRADFYLIPFSLFWSGFSVFWEINALRAKDISFPLFGIPFLVIGAYLVFGRFIYKYYKKKNTYYAVTDKRVLVLTQLWGRNLRTAYIDTVPTIDKSIRSDGVGTLRFGLSGPYSWIENSGFDFFVGFYGPLAPAFHDIKDAEKVYDIVNQLRNA